MMTLEEFFNKPHQTVDDVLEDISSDTFFNLLITEAIREEDNLVQNLEKIQNRLLQFDNSSQQNQSINDLQQTNNNENNPFEINPSDTESNNSNDLETFNFDDNAGNDTFQNNANELEQNNKEQNNNNLNNDVNSSDINSEQNTQDQKDKLLSNVKQLMKLRDLLEEVLSSVADPEFLRINQLVNKILSSIAGIGDKIMDREDIVDINTEIEQFLMNAVEKTKQKIDEIKDENIRKEA